MSNLSQNTKAIPRTPPIVALVLLAAFLIGPLERTAQADDAVDFGIAEGLEDGLPRVALRLVGGWQSTDYNVGGSDGNAGLPSVFGNFFGGDLTYRPKNKNFGFAFNYYRDTSSYTSLNAIPNTLTMTHQIFTGLLILKPYSEALGWKQHLELNLGYRVWTRQGAVNTPQLVNNATLTGVVGGLAYANKLGKNFNFDISGLAFVPITFTEDPVHTGYYMSAYGAEAGVNIFYAMTNYLQLGVGVTYNWLHINYSGKSDRAITNAAEADKNLGLPLELKITF